MEFRTFVPTADDSEKSWREARICNCAEHQGRPLADATMLLFDAQLKPKEPLAYQVEEYTTSELPLHLRFVLLRFLPKIPLSLRHEVLANINV
jgi:hypothetical protein